MRCAEFFGDLTGPAVKGDGRAPTRLPADFDIDPAYAAIPAGAERLHGSLFGRKTRSVALDTIGLGVAVSLLTFSKNPAQKTFAMTVDGLGYAGHFGDVNS